MSRIPERFARLCPLWIPFLVITYFLTWVTLWGINTTAYAWAKLKFRQETYWADSSLDSSVTIFATAQTMVQENGKVAHPYHLEPSEIGCKDAQHLPDGLTKIKSTWSLRPELAEEMAKRLFIEEPEDYFDYAYKFGLRFPLQPIEREKNFRKKYHLERLMLKIPDTESREQVLRHFSNVYGDLMKLFPCRMIRWFNGFVQVTAFAVFWLTLQLVIAQYYTGVRRQKLQASNFFPFRAELADQTMYTWDERPELKNEWLTPKEIDGELGRLYDPALAGEPRSAVLMLREVYETYLRGEINAQNYRDTPGSAVALEQAADREHRKIESKMAALVYLGWSLPSLGFIGTVLGLGTALLTAGDMVTPNSELQRDAIQTVSIYLGRAFDKTFVALVLSLLQMALVYGVRRAQESVVFDFQDKIARGVIPRMKC